jgi:hypothetical protein
LNFFDHFMSSTECQIAWSEAGFGFLFPVVDFLPDSGEYDAGGNGESDADDDVSEHDHSFLAAGAENQYDSYEHYRPGENGSYLCDEHEHVTMVLSAAATSGQPSVQT